MTDEPEKPLPPFADQDAPSHDDNPADAVQGRDFHVSPSGAFDGTADDAAELDSVLSQIEALAQAKPPPRIHLDPNAADEDVVDEDDESENFEPAPGELTQDESAPAPDHPAAPSHPNPDAAAMPASAPAGEDAPTSAPQTIVMEEAGAAMTGAPANNAAQAGESETRASAENGTGDSEPKERAAQASAAAQDGDPASAEAPGPDDKARPDQEASPDASATPQAGAVSHLALPVLTHLPDIVVPSPARGTREWLSSPFDMAALAVLAAIIIVALFTFSDYGISWDDYAHFEFGELLRQFYASGFTDQRVFAFNNLRFYGGGFDLGAALLGKVLPLTPFDTRRLAGAIVGVIALAITWRLGRRLGGPVGGFFTLVALALSPVFYGHMFMNPKDVPFTLAMALMLLGFLRGFEDYPRLSFGTITILGLGAGLAVGTRALAGFWVVAAFVIFVGLVIADRRQHQGSFAPRLGTALRRLAIALLIGVIAMAIVWPWVVMAPLRMFTALSYFSTFYERPWPELFNGNIYPVDHMPWTYLPVLFVRKLPEMFLLLALFGAIGALLSLRSTHLAPARKAALTLMLLAAFAPILIAMFSAPGLYNGIRHFLFVLPALAALAGLFAAWLIAQAEKKSRIAAGALAIVLLVPFALPLMAMARLHPFEYAYFNDSSGGVRKAEGRDMIDYWGLSFKQASEDLRDLLRARGEAPGDGTWKVALCGPTRAAEVFLGRGFKAGADVKGADFAITLGEFYCKEPALPVTLRIERDGHVFARVYDIRGINLDTLDKYPPVRAPAKAEP